MRDNTSDRQLVQRLRERDGTAMPELQTTYGARIYQLAFRYMKNREDAEEVMQDVLLRVFRKIDAFRGDSALSSWIYRITFNTAMSRLRTLKFRRPAEVPYESVSRTDLTDPGATREVMDWSGLADDLVLRSEMRTRLVSALSRLPEIYPGGRAATGCAGTLDRGGQCGAGDQASNLEVASASWPADSPGEAGRLRRWTGDALDRPLVASRVSSRRAHCPVVPARDD